MGHPRRDDRIDPYGAEAITPVDVDGVLATTVGTVLWALAFLVLLPFRGRLEDNDAEWWLWTCLAGVGLGLFGIAYCRRRRDRLAASARRTSDQTRQMSS
jgi:H+/Cl- antiporter ClcA